MPVQAILSLTVFTLVLTSVANTAVITAELIGEQICVDQKGLQAQYKRTKSLAEENTPE